MIERWLSTFHNDPQKAVNDLFSGRAGLGSGMRMDIPELLYQEFPPLPEFQDTRQQLDTALFAWFASMRKEYTRQVARLGFGVYSKRLCDCLIAAQLLDLQMFPYQLRQGLDSWLRWLTPLRLAPERDPALECWRLLGRQQEERSFITAWLRLASDGRPEYLDVALFGLQGACSDENKQVLMLLALMIHESVCYTSGAEANSHFKKQYAALRGLYSLNQQIWQQHLQAALAVFSNRAQGKAARELHQILSEKATKTAGSSKPKVFPVSTAGRESLFHALQAGQQKDAVQLAERFFENQEQNLRFAEQTGNSYFFIRTLSSQGSILLKRYPLAADAMRRLGRMIEQGLAWEPYNPFVWMLWADWYAKKKQFRQREWILRETVRLFPDNEPSRVELARLLINRGEEHWDEAEKWLREVIERNPDNEPSRVELARLLINRGEEHWDEAEKWLREVIERHPDNEPSRVELARLLINRGEEHWDEAENWLREVIDRHPDNEPSRVELARLLINRGEEHWDEAEHWLREVIDRHPDNEPSRVELARLLINRGEEHWDEAEHWLREVIDRHPDNEPSRVELARLLINRGEEHWDEAEEWLREAAERSPNHEPSRVELARLLINRGEEHWDEAEHWLHEVIDRHPNSGQAHQVLASLLAKRNKRAEAIDLLETLLPVQAATRILQTFGNDSAPGRHLKQMRPQKTRDCLPK